MNDSTTITQTCTRHNQPIISQANNESKCQVCLQEKTRMTPSEQYEQQLREIIDQYNENQTKSKIFWQNIYDSILIYKNNLVSILDKVLQIAQEQIWIISSHQQQFEKQINLPYNSNEDIEKQSWREYQQNRNVKNQVILLLDELQTKQLDLEQQLRLVDIKPKLEISEQILDWKKVQSEKVYQSSKNQKKVKALAFNQNGNILAVAHSYELFLYQFTNGTVGQELQKLTGHKSDILFLYFMKHSNSIISGSQDKSIIIWELDNDINKWFAKQVLKASFQNVLMDKSEDLLISSSSDYTIKFWRKTNNSWSCEQTISLFYVAFDMSLNEQENKLISCGGMSLIQILEKGCDNQWNIVQNINVSQGGLRLLFTTGDQFVIQPFNCDQLHVYSYDNGKKQFYLNQKVKIQYQEEEKHSFPCQYIKKLNLISVKNGQYLNLFKINERLEDYQLIQSIEFQSNRLSGRLTEDGQYLASWDEESKEIQIRKLKLLQ